jgi:hypothetical protein
MVVGVAEHVATGERRAPGEISRSAPGWLRALGMSDYEFTMSLRIRHPTIDPAQISQSLGIEPQHSWRAGEPRLDSDGSALEGAYRESYWMGRIMAEPALASSKVGVESQLLQMLAQLRRSFGFLESLKQQGAVTELQVSIFAREDFSLEFMPESLQLLGRLGLTVQLEVKPYPTRTGAMALD